MGHAKDYVEKNLMLYWEPETPAQAIAYCYDENMLIALEEYFGDFPIVIRREDLKVLRALQTARGYRPIDDIVAAVEKNGSIRIWWQTVKREMRHAGGISFIQTAITND